MDQPQTPRSVPVGKLEPAKPRKAEVKDAYVIWPGQPPSAGNGGGQPDSPSPEMEFVPSPASVPKRLPWVLAGLALGLLGLGGVTLALLGGGKTEPKTEPLSGPLVAEIDPDAFPSPAKKSGNDAVKTEINKGAGKKSAPEKKPIQVVVNNPVQPANMFDPTPKVAPPTWKPLTDIPGVNVKTIDQAITRGVAYLKKGQLLNGTWTNGGHVIGYAALPGLTLLECGVPASDPAVQSAAKFVRTHSPNLTLTYELALSILFLDRLGEARDRGLIQTLALRLVAGQNESGGWTYHCSVLPPQDSEQLLAFLQANRPGHFQNPLGKNADPKLQNPLEGEDAKLINIVPKSGEAPLRNPIQGQPKAGERSTDSKGDKQVIPPFPAPGPEAKDKKAAATKGKTKGVADPKAGRPDSLPEHLRNLPIVIPAKGKGRIRPGLGDNSNTQFAMLALWVARRHDVPTEQTLDLCKERFLTSQNGDGGWGYTMPSGTTPSMTCVGLLGMAMGYAVAIDMPQAKVPPGDPIIQKGLDALGRFIDRPAGPKKHLAMQNLYFLWSVERVAMLYNLPTISGKDWYGWGAQVLLKHQHPNGSWDPGFYHGQHPFLNTSFALLFLKRSNLVQDLSDDLPRLLTIIEAQKDRK